MKLQVGLFSHSLQWEELLSQEGVSWGIVDPALEEIGKNCSALIVNRALSRNECNLVEEYLKGGGGVLGCAQHLLGVANIQVRIERIEYLFNDHDPLFLNLRLMDLNRDGFVPREANHLRTQSNSFAVFAGELGGGVAVVLPFDIEAVMSDHRAVTKNFYFKVERLPAEQVSAVSKGEVRNVFRASLEYLHHARGVPYVHKWYFPYGRKNLLAFRVDTDGSSQENVDALYRCARSSNIGMSWFLDVKSHEQWLQHFSRMVGQEMGVHCYEHQTYPAYEANLRNLQKAMLAMEMSGIHPVGASAPFGVWNQGMAKALDDLGFEYSSEFSFAYDTFPLHPVHGETVSKTLQVPIHPICIGSLMKAGYSESRMVEYYSWIIEHKLQTSEPLFFYHHPSHKHWSVVESLFATLSGKKIEDTTFAEFSRWWKHRAACQLSVQFSESALALNGIPEGSDSICLRISLEGREATVPISATIDLSDLPWLTSETEPVFPDDLRRIREFDPRALVADLYTKIQRKFI